MVQAVFNQIYILLVSILQLIIQQRTRLASINTPRRRSLSRNGSSGIDKNNFSPVEIDFSVPGIGNSKGAVRVNAFDDTQLFPAPAAEGHDASDGGRDADPLAQY